MPAAPTWGGAMNQPWLPWTDWSQTPWAGLDPSLSAEGMQWFNTMLPWLQSWQQNQQWMNELAQRQAETGWSQGFQEKQFDWQQAVDQWTQAIQERQLRDQMEQANLAVFGRRWRPNTRWA
jgi:hypothetical protein